MAGEKLKVEEMITTVLIKTNMLIKKLEGIDPSTEQYGFALDNLAKSFQILSGAMVSSKKKEEE